MNLQSAFILVVGGMLGWQADAQIYDTNGVTGQTLAVSAAPREKLKGHHVPTAVAHLVPAGSLPGSQRLSLAIGLPLRNEQELDVLLQQLYDPASPNYHRYLTPEQFTARFGPSENDYQSLMDFAKSNGLTVTVTHPNRVVLDVEGAVADIQKAFHLTLRTYRHPREAREFYAPDAEPSVDFAVPILHISGLDNYSLPHPNFKVRPTSVVANPTPNAGSGPGGTYRGSDFRTAYVPGTTLNGTGQSVGLLEFDGFYTNDIRTYESQAGLPNVPLTVVPIQGGIGAPGGHTAEVSLDIEMVISMAPGLDRVYVYEALNGSPWVDLLSRMANDNLAEQLSCSWGGGSPNATAEQIFKQMASQGQSFFSATGDNDAFTQEIPFPSDSPNITAVGGTTLTTGAGASYSSETVWNWGYVTNSGDYEGSSGGISTYYPIPSYQQGISMVANQGSRTMRNIPDVALTADNVYVVYGNGTSGTFGGTSCAAPLWAGFIALVNQRAAAVSLPPVGFFNPALYSIGKEPAFASSFHDITTGNNTSSGSPNLFFAVPGYDLCTGWGTPKGTNLINILTRLSPWILSQPQSQTVNAGANATFSVIAGGKAPLSYQWFFNGKPVSTATGYSYSIARVQSIQAGTYTVVVSNPYGSVLSTPASLAITPGSGAFGVVGVPFSYQITADNNPNRYSASALPPGLHLDPLGGVIYGTPTGSGSFQVVVETKNDFGTTTSATVVIVIKEGAITSATSAPGIIGVPFSYQITADNNPNRFSASALPSGLHFDPVAGVIYGIPTGSGRFPVFVEANNNYGSASATIVIVVNQGAIISATSALGIVGAPFSYQIAADNNPNRYSASALPSGLHFDPAGVIYGIPTASGRFPIVVETKSDYGSASATIVIIIREGAITSATSAAGIVGVPFSYQIIADNNPNRYSASALPSGLHFDSLAGVIYGTPTVSGKFPVVVETKSDYGSASATIVIVIKEGAVTSATSAPGIVGVPFSYQITADNNPNRYSASALPSDLHFDPLAGVIYGIPTISGRFPVVVETKNNYGSASATIIIAIAIKESTSAGGTVSQPTLTISRTGNSLLLSWPATFSGFTLEESQLRLNAWTTSSANVLTQGNQNVALIPIQSTVKFYRLRK